jgi:hypothetical protein
MGTPQDSGELSRSWRRQGLPLDDVPLSVPQGVPVELGFLFEPKWRVFWNGPPDCKFVEHVHNDERVTRVR